MMRNMLAVLAVTMTAGGPVSADSASQVRTAIVAIRDSEQAYKIAADLASDPQLKYWLMEEAARRTGILGDLNQQLAGLGGRPEDTGVVSNRWEVLRSGDARWDVDHLLGRLEEGDREVLATYDALLKEPSSDDVRRMLERHREVMARALDQLRQQRGQLRRQ